MYLWRVYYFYRYENPKSSQVSHTGPLNVRRVKETLWVRLFWLLVFEVLCLRSAFSPHSIQIFQHGQRLTFLWHVGLKKKNQNTFKCFLLHGEACDPLMWLISFFLLLPLCLCSVVTLPCVSKSCGPSTLSLCFLQFPPSAAAAAATASLFRRYVLRTIAAPICHKCRRALCNVDVLETVSV